MAPLTSMLTRRTGHLIIRSERDRREHEWPRQCRLTSDVHSCQSVCQSVSCQFPLSRFPDSCLDDGLVRLCSQGFPLHPSSTTRAAAGPITSFDIPLERHPRRIGEQAENSMNIAVLQLVQLHSLLSTVPRKVPNLCLALARFKRSTDEHRKRNPHRIWRKMPAEQALWAGALGKD